MGQCARARLEQRGGVGGHRLAARDLVSVDLAGVLGARVVAHPVERPGEVDRGRAGRAQDTIGLVEVLVIRRRQCVTVGGGDADRRCAAHRELANRLGHVGGRATVELDLLERKPALVEHDDPVGLEPEDRLRFEITQVYVPSSQDARYFACSSLSLSMSTPMVSSFSRAISSSISVGTGYTFGSRDAAFCTAYSVARA